VRYLSHRLRVSQPQGPARVNWANPITRGLKWVYAPFTTLASDVRLPGVSFVPDPGAVAAASSHGHGLRVIPNGSFYVHGVNLAFTGPLAYDSIVSEPAAVLCVISDWSDAAVSPGMISGPSSFFGVDGGSGVLHLTGSAAGLITGNSPVPSTGRVVAGFEFQSSVTRRLWLNGRLDHQLSDNGYSVGIDRIGSAGGSGRLTHTHYLTLRWARFLSATEHRSLAVNPWQVFA
jgi:hypothetical protein